MSQLSQPNCKWNFSQSSHSSPAGLPVCAWICIGPSPLKGAPQPRRTPGIWHWSREKKKKIQILYICTVTNQLDYLCDFVQHQEEKRTCFCTCQTNLENLPLSLQRNACLFLKSHRMSLFSTPSSPLLPPPQCLCWCPQHRAVVAEPKASDLNSLQSSSSSGDQYQNLRHWVITCPVRACLADTHWVCVSHYHFPSPYFICPIKRIIAFLFYFFLNSSTLLQKSTDNSRGWAQAHALFSYLFLN